MSTHSSREKVNGISRLGGIEHHLMKEIEMTKRSARFALNILFLILFPILPKA